MVEHSCQDKFRLDSGARNDRIIGPNLVTGDAAGNGPKEQFWGSRLSSSGWPWPALAIFERGQLGNWSPIRKESRSGHVDRSSRLTGEVLYKGGSQEKKHLRRLEGAMLFAALSSPCHVERLWGIRSS